MDIYSINNSLVAAESLEQAASMNGNIEKIYPSDYTKIKIYRDGFEHYLYELIALAFRSRMPYRLAGEGDWHYIREGE